jgi:hypothetical protein
MRLLLALSCWKQTTGLLFLMAAFGGYYCVDAALDADRHHFENVYAFKDFCTEHGFYFHSGTAYVYMCGETCFIADHPVTKEDLAELRLTRNCGLTPNWRGIIWVSRAHSSSLTIYPEHIGGNWRLWGNVVVAGDAELMDRIEALQDEK